MNSKHPIGRHRGKALIATALVGAAVTIAAASGWVAQPAATAAEPHTNIVAEIDSIPGESQLSKGAVDVVSWSFGS
jgi:hypothetical protein